VTQVTFASYLLLGLATSLHCVAMCGSLVLTYSVSEGSGAGVLRKLAPHLAYQGSKIASYMAVAAVLGAISGTVGAAFDISGVRNWIMLVAGVYMVLLGVGMTGYVPWLRRLSPRPPRFLVRLLSRNRKRALADKAEGETHLVTPITFGLLTGLMPCAPLIAAQVGAMSSGSPVTGMTLMLAFGLGTAPLMLAFGLASSFASGAVRERMQYVAAAAVIVFGLLIFNRGLVAVGSPVTFESAVQSIAGTKTTGVRAWRDVGGVAEYDLVIADTRFVPDVVELPADRPVRLVVDRREDNACSAQLAVPQLGILADLKPFAKTVVDLPATRAGSYTLTCGMAMMSGRLIFGQPAGGGGYAWVVVIAIALTAVVGALALKTRRRAGSETGAGNVVGQDTGATTLMGFTVAEALVVLAAVLLAVMIGLYAGGAFGPR
jgi:sulfite exporter TauE/SafE